MSELFDDEPGDVDTRRPGGRARALVITGVVLIVAFFALTTFASIYTDRLWYDEVGYGQVFSTMLWTRVGLFLVFGVMMGAAVAVNMYLAYRFRPLFRMPGGDGSVDRYRDAVTPIRTWLLAGVATVIGLFAGTSALGHWRTYLLWRNAQPFNQEDAYFNKDISFYVFSLPWWHYVVDFVMAAAIVAVLATAVVHYLYGGIRLQVQHDRLSGAAQVQFSVLLGIFVLAKGVDYYLDRFDLVTNDNHLFTGMNYTGENAILPARNILMGVALICAVLFFLNIWRRTWQLPSVGLALLVLSAILLGMIWPAIVQNFQVKPDEPDKEESYIQANIDATRDAYGIDGVDPTEANGVPGDDVDADALATQLRSVPVVDPKQVFETFEQRQQPRLYYSVSSVLDVDRYPVNGVETPLVMGVREVDQSGINDSDRNWANLHTVYTHGEGVIAAYANRVSPNVNDPNGRMVWAEGITQGAENIFTEAGFEDRVYYGEQSPDYSVVGKASDDSEDVELGLDEVDAEATDVTTDEPTEEPTDEPTDEATDEPTDGATDEATDEVTDGATDKPTDEPTDTEGEDVAEEVSDTASTYDGDGGVPIGNTFRQLMYAVKFGEPNFLLSGRVNDNSRVLYNREPVTRVEKVAPWLTVDSDPYPAVIDGRIQWILDGYTTTDRYPNSQRESFESMIEDALQANTGLQTVPTDEINYMRSAVKATVDAYDGTVTLYAWDEEDPILRTWMSAFPGSVQPKSAIPQPLMDHLRYPEDLFKVQRYQLARYHVKEADRFYQGNDRWEVPTDPQSDSSQQPPYRLFAQTGAEGNEWSLTSVFVPRGRGNLASFVSVNSDANSDDFGQIELLEMTDEDAAGPGIAANEMQQDEGVRDALRDYVVANTPPVFGNLLTIPVENGLISVQPVYAVRSNADSSFPILQFVIVRYGSDVGIGRDIPGALANALNVDITTPPDGNGGNGGNGGDGGGKKSLDEQIAEALRDADRAYDEAEDALRDGNTVKYARKLNEVRRHLNDAVTLADRRDAEAQTDDESSDLPSEEPTDGQ